MLSLNDNFFIMKKTKLITLRVLLIILILCYIFALLFYFLITFTGGHTVPKELFRSSVFGVSIESGFYIYLIVTTVANILLIYALVLLLKVTDYFKNNFFFSDSIILLLKSAGKSFIGIAVIGFLASVFYHYSFSEHFIESMLFPFFYHFMILIVGLGILVVEDIQTRALIIKTENELTI